MPSLKDIKKRIVIAEKQRAAQKFALSADKVRLELCIKKTGDIEAAIGIVQKVSFELQQQVHKSFSDVVTTCLQDVFGSCYEFKIKFENKRNKTEARPVLVFNGNEIDDPLNEDSGGVCDIASFALRVTRLLLNKPPVRKLLILDEPFKFVALANIPAVVEMLNKVSTKLGVQIIMVTHIDELKTGKIIEL